MKYDIHILQVFQETLDRIKEIPYPLQVGICREIEDIEYEFGWTIRCWMRDKYMPYKRMGMQWWPMSMYHPDEILEQAKQDRISFLERIIEDLMCGE